jgi:hypothetical protein
LKRITLLCLPWKRWCDERHQLARQFCFAGLCQYLQTTVPEHLQGIVNAESHALTHPVAAISVQ